MAGFATLSGGDVTTFNLDSDQASAIQNALDHVGGDYHLASVGDFNGDHSTDMMLRSSITGDFGIYNMNNGTVSGYHDLGAVGNDWNVAGIGDFNGDHTTDMILRSTITGDFGVYSINNESISSYHDLGAVGNDWQVAGFGDFNGDGTTDMTLRNTSGESRVYDIKDNAVSSSHLLDTVLAGDSNDSISLNLQQHGSSGILINVGTGLHTIDITGDGTASVVGGGNDTISFAGNGSVDASGMGGSATLLGGSGSATLLGGSGTDAFFGGSGNTSMVGSNWASFTGGAGHDTMVAHTVPSGGVDQNVFNFDAAVGGNHEIDGYNSTLTGGDTAIHLTFTNYGLTSTQIVADSAIVGHDTVITLPGAGGNSTTITIKDYTGLADSNVISH
jgi:hypothetical protein